MMAGTKKTSDAKTGTKKVSDNKASENKANTSKTKVGNNKGKAVKAGVGKGENGKADFDFTAPEYYTNRELSWILFDHRVLNEARDKSNPLFERLKFLSITASNLDEFFMIRVASLKDMVNAGYEKTDISGMTPKQQLAALDTAIHELVNLQYSTYNRSLFPALVQNGLTIVKSHEQLTKEEGKFIDQYFEENVYPVLTPMAVDSSRPFPLIRNKTLNIGAMVRGKDSDDELEFATVQVPGVLSRVVELPERDGMRRVIFLEEIIERNINKLFLNYDIICAHPFRIMRNADLTIEEDEAEDLLKEIEKQIKMRQWGEAIRLEVEAGTDKRLLQFLEKELSLEDENIYSIDGPLDLTVLMKLYGLEGFEHLKDPKYVPQAVPQLPTGCNILEEIRKGDILLHHPYQTFTPVVEFIRQAAVDPNVLAIKQTLYRVSGNSPIIAALAQAAENGKQVSVLVELKARFDEENNIVWARKLEKAGCHVIYGLVGLKTHSKITLVVRREEDGIRRYVHLGTGNYNDATAKLYTDMGLLTCSEPIGEDATAVFNMLSGYSEPLFWNKLSLAPLWLKEKFLYLIEREKKYAKEGCPARIIAKMNSLCDRDVMAALYEAAAAGVKIDLIVRGICCLKVGIPGVSENITVRSIVGTFLEHARIFYFENNEHPEFYCGSADWMPRNLDRRVEILFPVEEPALREELWHVLTVQLADTLKAAVLQPDGSYEKVDGRGRKAICAQTQFAAEAVAKAKEAAKLTAAQDVKHKRTFTPAERRED
ncbi:MAG: RNA degradosome polyphosphate kinase [Lachnospiraceae bacterium]|nr:RNA degradosome polyphosphate kinase [Lachnospiraceae bacterium]